MKIGPPSSSISPAPSTSSSSKQSFQSGQMLQGIALAHNDDGSYTLDIGGQKILARSAIALPLNEQLLLEVKSAGTTPWLSIAPNHPQQAIQDILKLVTGGLLHSVLFSESTDILLANQPNSSFTQGLQELLSLLGNFNAKPDFSSVVLLLQHFNDPQKDGLTDILQRLAVELPHLQKDAAHIGASQHLRQLEQVCNLCDLLQQINSAQGGYFIYPCFFQDASGQGTWFLSSPDKETTAMDFFLTMSKLGDVHIQATLSKDTVDCTFSLADRNRQQHLQKVLPQLQQALTALGLPLRHCSCTVASSNIAQQLKEKCSAISGTNSLNIINLTA